MRGATLHLNDMLEDREREQRRRARKAFAGAVLVALLGIAAAMREPPAAPPPSTKIEVRERVVEVECAMTQTVPVAVIVRTPVPGPVKLRQYEWPSEPLPPLERPTRHLCVTPRRINFGGATTTDRVTVANIDRKSVV